MFYLQNLLTPTLYNFIYEKKLVETVTYNLVKFTPYSLDPSMITYKDFSIIFDYRYLPEVERQFWVEINEEFIEYEKHFHENFKFLQ